MDFSRIGALAPCLMHGSSEGCSNLLLLRKQAERAALLPHPLRHSVYAFVAAAFLAAFSASAAAFRCALISAALSPSTLTISQHST